MISMPLDVVAHAIEAQCASPVQEQHILRVVIDSRIAQPGDLFVAIRGERFNGHDFIQEAGDKGAGACVVDRKWYETLTVQQGKWHFPILVVKDTVAALGELAGFYRRAMMSPATVVVAVTGSNGKTTTQQMIDHVLRESLRGRASPRSFNNQYGVPLTLLSADADDDYLIVEIGTNAPGEIAALSEIVSPDIGVITSIGEAHVEGLDDIESIAREKTSLLSYLRPGGSAMVNIDREQIVPLIEQQDQMSIITFGFSDAADHRIQVLRSGIDRTLFEIDGRYRIELALPGLHHATNAAAAFLVARRLGLVPETIMDRLSSFTPSDGRARVIKISGVTLIDDVYNANPSSVSAALETLRHVQSSRRIFVLGDMLELGQASADYHRRVIRSMMDLDIEVIITIGEVSSTAARDVEKESDHSQLFFFSNADDACPTFIDLLTPGDTVWIKGSRAMALEKVVEAAREHLSRKTVVA